MYEHKIFLRRGSIPAVFCLYSNMSKIVQAERKAKACFGFAEA